MSAGRRVLSVLAVALLGAAGLAGCASSGSGAGAGVGAGGSGASSSPTGPVGVIPTTPGPSAPPSSTLGPPPVGVTVTVSGTVIQGAEPSCLILRSDRGELELLTNKGDAHAGDHVTATGHVVRVMSHCMQGEPFQVDALTVG